MLAVCLLVAGGCAVSGRTAPEPDACAGVVARALANGADALEMSMVDEPPTKLDDARLERMMEDSIRVLGLDSFKSPVTLTFRITREGSADRVTVTRSSGSPAFDAVAAWAIEQGRFTPARIGGCPVPVRVEVPISASMQ